MEGQTGRPGTCLPTVVLPTYNERENLPSLVRAILALPEPVSVLVVDDNSPDGTGLIADGLASECERVSVIHRRGKLGLGTAYVAGFRALLSSGADLVLTMDADFSHHPRYIPAMLDRSRQFDVVIGSRYVPGGGTRSWGLHRQLLSRTANAVARTALGLQPHDCTAGFRCYHRRVLEAIPLGAIVAEGYSFLVEMLYRIQASGYRIGEVPIIFEDRRDGTSKISRMEILKAMRTVARLGVERAGLAPAGAPGKRGRAAPGAGGRPGPPEG